MNGGFKLLHGDVEVAFGGEQVVITDENGGVMMHVETARWLQAVALPAALHCMSNDRAEVPSEPPAKVDDGLDERGQIKGQLAID